MEARTSMLRRIELCLSATGLTATRFGRDAACDPMLVHDLRRGREPGRRMVARIERHLERLQKEFVA